ncbi:hypothetical protein ACQP2T_10310 [Nonomuraea sp. CA-143628]|uniref:hypothetical protein n=1 Tax=Nonomuraea sp. CA-143628 TaxID=3239997 RepID=UPI003D8E0229
MASISAWVCSIWPVRARSRRRDIGFGGVEAHFCVGNHLAKLELRALFEQLARRYPRLRQTGEARRLRANFINDIKELPVVMD